MTKVKITVVKKFTPKDVIGKDFIRESGEPIPPCFLEEGAEYIVDEKLHIQMPEGFCPHAWYGIFKDFWMLKWGGGYQDWTGENVAYATCPDGIRPVCFKLERLESNQNSS